MTAGNRALLLFSRLPRLGRVKTRLTPRFTAQEALALHRALLADSIDLLRRCGEATGASCWLYLSEAGDLEGDLSTHLGPTRVRIQQGADLGERLLQAFRECLEGGHAKVVVLGSDSPHLPGSYVARAFEELDRGEIVVGPARDGGYYLVGASRTFPSLFAGMPWGTSQVYRETVRRGRREGITITSLPAWDDVDLPESVAHLFHELTRRQAEGSGAIPQATLALLQAWAASGKLG